MKISQKTISLLENFQKINNGLVVDPGSVLSTVSPTGNIIATANIDEEFPLQVCVYNLQEFLTVVNLFPDSELDINEQKITFKSSAGGATIVQSVPNLITNLSGKKIPSAEPIVSFTFPTTALATIPKMQLTLPNVELLADGELLRVRLLDLSNPSTTVLEFNVSETDKKFKAHLVSELFSKIQRSDSPYIVDVCNRFIVISNVSLSVKYWLVLDSTSKFQ